MKVQEDSCRTDISDRDILSAMKRIPGYIDITPADFKAVYATAYHSAIKRLRRSVRAKDIMTPKVVALSGETSLAEAARLLGANRISGAPVIDGHRRVIGVVSEKDFLHLMGVSLGDNFMAVVAKCLGTKGCPAMPGKKQTVADLMNAPAITVGEDTTVIEISELMLEKRVNRLPVTDASGRLSGIITRSNVILSFCSLED